MDLSTIISKQFPEFVREDYPAFTEFVKAYYKFLESESLGKVETLLDIDNTIESFVQYFKRELDINGPNYNAISERIFLKNSKQLFTAKGSEESYKFFFRALYGKESELIHPWDYVLIPSEGKWFQELSIFVQITAGDADTLAGQYIIITDSTGKEHRAFVDAEKNYAPGVYELFLDNFRERSVAYNDTFRTENRSVTGRILPATISAKVIHGSSGFEVGQIFSISGITGRGTVIKVKSVDSNGGILAVDIISFGVGYNTDFTVELYPLRALKGDKFSNIAFDTNEDEVFELQYPTNDILNNIEESFTASIHNYTLTAPTKYFSDLTYVGQIVAEGVSQNNLRLYNLEAQPAVILMTLGAICKYPGRYLTGESILGDLCYVQDSYYYQKFAYVTVVEETFNTYAEILKRTLHPIGTIGFGTYSINNEFTLSPSVDPELSLSILSLADVADTTDNIRFEVSKVLVDDATITDAASLTVGKLLVDTYAVDDTIALQITKNLSDSVTATDDITQLTPATGLVDSATITETTAISVDKYITDEAVTTNTGIIYKSPYYYDLADVRYSQAGYLDNETEITN